MIHLAAKIKILRALLGLTQRYTKLETQKLEQD